MKKVKKEGIRDFTITKLLRKKPTVTADEPTRISRTPRGDVPRDVEMGIPGQEDLETQVKDMIIKAGHELVKNHLDILAFLKQKSKEMNLPEDVHSNLRKMVMAEVDKMKAAGLMQENKQLGRWKKLAGILN